MPGDSVDSVTLTSLGAFASASVAGSPYAIIPSNEAGTGVANYTVTYVPGELTITPAVADIAVTGYTVPYDGLPHTATGTATGALGEDLAGLLDLSATTHTAAGTYPVDAWTFHDPAGNYADASGTVADAITPAPLTVTANDQTRPYGTPNPALDATDQRLRQRRDPGHQRRDRQPRLLHDRGHHEPGQRQPVPDHLQPRAPWPRPTTRSRSPRAS